MKLVALSLLIVAAPAFAAPQGPKRPSAIDVDATLVHDRDVLTKQATAMCACEDAACGKKVIADFLLWEQELTLVRGRKGFEDYVDAVDNDETIKDQRGFIEDCNALLLAKPWAASCKKRFANAARSFAREAPRTYAPYKRLDFRNNDENGFDGRHAIASARATPGRSWEFLSVFGPASLARTKFGVTDLTDAWTMVDSERGVIAARSYGPWVAVLRVESERWGDFEPAHHPLTKLYFEKLRETADKCERK
jgi:hypothetical protein